MASQRAKRIHITGSPRSGTTLLLALMLSCFDIDGGVTAERRLWRTPPKGRRVVCTKFPDETDFATSMLGLDPDLHVVYIMRDPRDVIVSTSHVAPERYLTNLRIWKKNLKAAKSHFGHRRFHVIDYSDLASDPDGVQVRLAADMPFLKMLRPFSRFTECARGEDGEWLTQMHMKLRPIAPDRVGSWQAHLRRVKGQMIIHGEIADDLMLLGFEPDKAWLSLLDGVRPDLRASEAHERVRLQRTVTRVWRNVLGTIIYLARRYLNIELSQTGERKTRPTSAHGAANENATLAVVGKAIAARKTGAA